MATASVSHVHVEVEPGREAWGVCTSSLGALGDHPADVVGQAAVGEGDMVAALEEDDLGVLRRRRARAAAEAPPATAPMMTMRLDWAMACLAKGRLDCPMDV